MHPSPQILVCSVSEADWGPCYSFPFLPQQWLSSSPASAAAAALIAALHMLAGVSRAPTRGCYRKAFQGKGSSKRV
eukprot:116579-Pelagomonas_calceolata.AAC.1